MRCSANDFHRLVDRAIADLPERLAGYLKDVVIDVEPMPDRATLDKVELADARDLLGLYLGTPMTERGIDQGGTLPDRIVIYQRNIERICATREDVIEEVRRTVLHEIGHHFGLDEDELDELGYG